MVLIERTALIGFSSIVELLSLLMSLAIGWSAYRIYRITKEKKYFYFSTAFIFITIAFLIRAFLNAGIYFGRRDVVEIAISTSIISVHKALSIVYLMLMISAYVILIILTFKIRDFHLVSLLAIFVLTSVVATYENFVVFPILSLLLLLYLIQYYYTAYTKKHNKTQLAIMWGFIVIALSQLLSAVVISLRILNTIHLRDEWLVASTLIQLLGYTILLGSLISVLKK